jgi:dolichyl-phosphate beta-glucosyltransferase
MKRVSIVVPSYNEPALDALAERLTRVLPPDSEILFVDDSDVLPVVANARVIRGAKRGIGDAVRLGFLASEGEVVFHLDADVDDATLTLIPAFIGLIDAGNDVAMAERRGRLQYRNVARLILSAGLFVAQRVFVFQSARFFDTQCGFKAFRRDAAQRLATLQTVSGGMYDIEYLYIAVKSGMRIAQVPVPPMPEVRSSRIRVLRCLVTDPLALLRVKWNGLRGRYSR